MRNQTQEGTELLLARREGLGLCAPCSTANRKETVRPWNDLSIKAGKHLSHHVFSIIAKLQWENDQL